VVSTTLQQSLDAIADGSEFSGVAQVLKGGEVLYERASGFADRAHGIANTIETRFGIASGCKGFTALVVMSLVNDEVLDLNTTVRSVLGDELDQIDPGVTVAHLLSHTSGIGDYLDESVPRDIAEYTLTVPVHQLATTADYLAVLRGHPTKLPPGERFEYCNGGFVVLALMAEVAAQSSFFDLAARRVFEPAGMAATEYLRSDQLPGSAAIGYLPTDEGWRTNHFHLPIRGSGDGGCFSTLGDMARFWPALFSGKILPRPLVDEMVRPHNDVPEENLRYGLGFWVRADRATVMLEGMDVGVSFRSAYDPASEVLYTVISNEAFGAWALVKELDRWVPELVQRAG
jgi:CubicO group peptidase (beta-lactamase class C family)